MSTSLQFVKSASTSSAVSELKVENCFSDKYDTYKVILQVDSVTQEAGTSIRLVDSSNNTISASEYDFAYEFMRIGNGSYSSQGYTGESHWNYTMYNEGTVGGFFVMYIYHPYDSSSYTFAHWQMATHYLASSTSTFMARRAIGVHKVAEQITGIAAIQSSTRLDGAKLSVYGVE
tara:strand:- start:1096 stop:1620 length:525 start_codon:yes stop_codon:yes gene_type:complete